MIVYNLVCGNNHRFEGWFGSSEDFERQQKDQNLSCPLCGSTAILRLPHAPYVNAGSEQVEVKASPVNAQQYANLPSDALNRLVRHIVETSEDVGAAFPEEARKIHYGEAEERRIRGTASLSEVRDLKEEGIEVVALPLPPHRPLKPH